MSRICYVGHGPTFNDVLLLNELNAAPTGVSIVSTTAVDAHTPDGGGYWLKLQNLSGAGAIAGRSTESIPGPSEGDAWMPYFWKCVRNVVYEGTVDADKFVTVGAGHNITILRIDDNTYNFGISIVGVRGGTTINVNDKHSVRIEQDVNLDIFQLWVDGVLDGWGTLSSSTPGNTEMGMPDMGSTGTLYVAGQAFFRGDSPADTPDTDIEVKLLQGDSDWATEQEYGDNADCTSGSTSGVNADIVLDGSDQVDTSIYWCENAFDAGKQMSELTAPGFSAGYEMDVLMVHGAGAASLAAKTVTTWFRIHDGTNASEIQNANFANTSFLARHGWFFDPPTSGDAWDDVIDSLKLGIRSGSGNGANNQWAAVIGEAIGSKDDPQPMPGGVAMGSANVGMY